MKNPGYYDRRIKQYQKKHGISDESKPTMSKIRLKRDIESDSDYEEMEPPKRRKIGGGRGVKSVSVSGMIRFLVDSHPCLTLSVGKNFDKISYKK